jgi:hypothetical protein
VFIFCSCLDNFSYFANMTSVIEHRRKHRSSPPQPLDRHLSEIGERDGTVYINAGIDSTWLVIFA